MLSTYVNSTEELITTVWPTNKDGKAIYPEQKYCNLKPDQERFGVAFSGGGTRSASATLGQLRALKEIGWLPHKESNRCKDDRKVIDYLSAVSGGSWTVIPYTYLKEKYSDESFLDRHFKPKGIITHLNERCKGTVDSGLNEKCNKSKEALSIVIRSSYILHRVISEFIIFSRDESFSRSVGRIFLNAFGIGSRRMFYSYEKDDVKKIIDSNPSLNKNDFYYVEKNRPYLIVNGTLLAGHDGSAESLFPFEMTPLYVGTPIAKKVLGPFKERFLLNNHCNKVEQQIGGGFIQPFAFDSKLISQYSENHLNKAKVSLRKRNPFSLSDMAGTSGAAPQQTILKIKIDDFGFPEFNQWPIRNSCDNLNDSQKCDSICEPELSYGDGGFLDHQGLIPLLARGVEKIIVFSNYKEEFKPLMKINCSDTEDKSKYCRYPAEQMISEDITSLFIAEAKTPAINVFENGSKKLQELLESYINLKSKGRPLVYCDKYKISKNELYSLLPETDYEPTICWAYLDRTSSWVKEFLITGRNDNTKDGIDNKFKCQMGDFKDRSNSPLLTDAKRKKYKKYQNIKSIFENFPQLKTFGEQSFKIIDLKREHVHALSNLTAWSLINTKDYLDTCLFGGDFNECEYENLDDLEIPTEFTIEEFLAVCSEDYD